MAQMPTKEELVKKYGTAFQEIKELSFGVEFPDKQKRVLYLLTPHQYRAFVNTIKAGLQDALKATQTKFEIYDKPHSEDGAKLLKKIIGNNITELKPLWQTDEAGKFKKNEKGKRIPLEDEYGQQAMKAPTNIRIKVGPLDIQEYPANKVKALPPTAGQMLNAADELLWGNARALLQILFPNDSETFTPQYIDTKTNIPFMRMLFRLVIDMNELDFLIPFVKDMFPIVNVLFKKEPEPKKQTLQTE